MRSTATCVSRRMSRIRSWVMGRAVSTPCSANAIAVASPAPIQIGRYRSPFVSLSKTIGWFEGSSTRTPTSESSIMTARLTPTPRIRHGPQPPLQQIRRGEQAAQVPHRDDIGQIAVAALEVEPVADHEDVRYLKPSSLQGHWDDPPDALVEQRHGLERSWAALCKGPSQVVERQPRVHDVFDQQHVPTRDVALEVLYELHDSRLRPGSGVGGDGDEVHHHLRVEGAQQVGEKQGRPLQHADHHEWLAAVRISV